MPMPGKEWATECFECWKKSKNPETEVKAQPKTKDTSSFYVAYAKDLVVSMIAAGNKSSLNTLMAEAIDTIKLAQEAFN